MSEEDLLICTVCNCTCTSSDFKCQYFLLLFNLADFQRRERVLEDLAQFKGALVVLFFCHRDWLQSAGNVLEFMQGIKYLNGKIGDS